MRAIRQGPGPTPQRSGPRTGPLARLHRLLARIVESGVPDPIQDPDSRRRARILLSFTLALILLGFEAVAFFSWALPPDLALGVSACLLAALGLVLAIPAALRRGSIALGANLMLSGSYLVIIASVLSIGGVRAPVIHWLALLPMLAVLMGARRSAWAWIGVALLTVTGLVLADVLGVRLPDEFGVAEMQGRLLWIQRYVDVGSWLGILFAVSMVYEAQKRRQTHELAEKATQLESEVAQRSRAERRNQYLAYYDDLTTLPNRRLFQARLRTATEAAARSDRQVAVLFLDLDGFKEVNDTHGHGLGDRLLQQVAERLQRCIRASDVAARSRASDPQVVSRLGGDEFTILLTRVRNRTEAALVAERILACLEPPFPIGDHEVFISASIGVALHSGGPGGVDDLLRNADMAMYHAKERGKNNFQFFDDSMNTDLLRYSTLAGELRKALERNELELHFQPIVRAGGPQVPVGVEALARWTHPEEGSIPPSEFISVAEGSGLMVPLGQWIFREACRQYAGWRDAGLAPSRIAVNVSGVQLRGGALAKTVVEAMREFDLPAGCLELEVTEGAMLLDEDEASRCLEDLKRLGVRVALDDFGTGYSSLSYVKRFPVDSLKIDRSFVRDLATDSEAQAIVTAIIAMAHRLGLEVVGEGVESGAQEAFLCQHGCDELQGYRFGKPMTAAAMTRLLAQHRPSPDAS
jgi:diguanylate cyclase (GGDEF)-like protein